MNGIIKWIAPLLSLILLSGCGDSGQVASKDQPQLLIYCGITMVNPVKEIANLLEPELGVRFLITQGGSEDLYQSLKAAQKGDIYLPGSASYRKRHLEEGLLGEYVSVGYNQSALFVQKDNPLKLSASLEHLRNPGLRVVIGDANSGSVGREAKNLLEQAGIYEEVRKNAIFLSTDSRNTNNALKNGEADIAINWRATGFFSENRDFVTVLDLPRDVAKPKELQMNLLSFSGHPEKARAFMQFAASEPGQAIFRKYGFLDNRLQADVQ
jgi:molybdate transport system substrate-binding protein